MYVASKLANYVPSYEPGCANPENLDETALINTAASITRLTLKAPASTTANENVQISVIQPGGNKMITSHAVNLLLSKLPANAKIGHRLPGLVNNLISVSMLCDAGCEVFFHSTGCKVTHKGETMLKGWRDQHNKLC